MKHESRLNTREAQKATEAVSSLQQGQGATFETPEEALRADREGVQVPATVAERLEASIARTPLPRRPWWRRLLGL